MLRFICVLLLIGSFSAPLSADLRKCVSNDTVANINDDQNNLMKFLKGEWKVSGTWQVVEGKGKIKKTIKARLIGSESYSLILNGHFLKKDRSVRIKYNSRELDKKMQSSFSSMTLLTFNNNLNKFFMWYYDCSGGFLESDGKFNHDYNHYVFDSKTLDANHNEVESQYALTIIDKNHYRWEVKQRKDSADEWVVTSTGLATRK